MPFVTSDGANIFLEVAGLGTPILLAHGFGMDHRQWQPQWESFAAHNQVIGIDLRGHGSSAPTATGYTYTAMGRDLHRIMVQVGIDRLNPGFIVAHSLSADAALQAALSEPRALRGVIVATPAVWGQSWSDEWLALWHGMRDDARQRGAGAAFERFRADPLFDGLRDRPDLWSLVHDTHRATSIAPLVHGERDTGAPTLERLSGCKVPVLVLEAGRDRDDFRASARAIAATVPGAELQSFSDSGHFPNLEVAATFTTTVLDFVARHSA